MRSEKILRWCVIFSAGKVYSFTCWREKETSAKTVYSRRGGKYVDDWYAYVDCQRVG